MLGGVAGLLEVRAALGGGTETPGWTCRWPPHKSQAIVRHVSEQDSSCDREEGCVS